MIKFIITFIVTMLISGGSDSQLLNRICGTRSEIFVYLGHKYNEVPFSRGLSQTGRVFEIWVNDDTRTFSNTITSPNGQVCIVGYGTDFEALRKLQIPGKNG